MNEGDAILVFGEVLVDQFPGGQHVLGGAPFNVAWHLTAFGQNTRFISCIGDDPDGKRIRTAMSDWGMDLTALQISQTHSTGAVAVAFENGQPTYDILQDRAYDTIDGSRLAPTEYALLYHGTLALRAESSRRALETLKQNGDRPIFMDVNLRDPWWDGERVLRLADEASWVKLNDDELRRLSGKPSDIEVLAQDFLDEHDLMGIIVTRGEQGALALTREGDNYAAAPERTAHVIDTVGAGDAFAAIMLIGIVRGWPIAKSLIRAQEFASVIVQNRGAILRDRTVYDRLADSWQEQSF